MSRTSAASVTVLRSWSADPLSKDVRWRLVRIVEKAK